VPFKVVSDSTITTVSPACPPTTCETGSSGELITVIGPTGSGSARQGFQPYAVVTGVQPNSGPPGTTVTVSGNGFFLIPSHPFAFGGLPATDVDCSIDGNVQCTMVVPGPGSGSVPVTLGGPPATSEAKFTYTSGPIATCSIQVLGCPAGGGSQLYSVTCGVPHDFSVNRVFQTTATAFTGQEAPEPVVTGVQACFPKTSDCQQFTTVATQVCPIGPPPTKPLPNCNICRETDRPCVAVAGGFQCVGSIK